MGVWGPAIEVRRSPRCTDRAGFARTALAAHAAEAEVDEVDENAAEPTAVIHLLCDLMHLSMDLGCDFSRLLGAAERHFLEERLLEQPRDAAS